MVGIIVFNSLHHMCNIYENILESISKQFIKVKYLNSVTILEILKEIDENLIKVLERIFPLIIYNYETDEMQSRYYKYSDTVEMLIPVQSYDKFMTHINSYNLRQNLKRYMRVWKKYELKFNITSDIELIDQWYFHVFIPHALRKRINPYNFVNPLVFSRYIKSNNVMLAYATLGNYIAGGFLVEIHDNEDLVFIKSIASKEEFQRLCINDFLMINIAEWSYQQGFKYISLGLDPNPMFGNYVRVFIWKNKWKPLIRFKGEEKRVSINENELLRVLRDDFLLFYEDENNNVCAKIFLTEEFLNLFRLSASNVEKLFNNIKLKTIHILYKSY